MSELSDAVRKNFAEGDRRRDAGLTTPDGVVRFDDIPYGEDAPKWQALDVYRPKNREGETLPVIVSVHGGGWVYGDKAVYQFYCMSLAERGFAVVNFTYRLAPEYKFPASLEDTNLVMHWIRANAAAYGFDTEHVFAVGDSAGAHILGLYCAVCTNPAYAKEYAFRVPEGFSPAAVALNCGKYKIRPQGGEEMTDQLVADFLPEGGTEEELARIDVISHVTSGFPPVFLMTANDDFLKAEAPLLAEKLMECDVPFVYRFYGTKQRRLAHVFHCDVKTKDAAFCNDEECGFFWEHIV